MKEFDYLIDAGLYGGLSPEDTMPVNSKYLWACYNLEPTEMGIRTHQYITDLRTMGTEDPSDSEVCEICDLATSFNGGSGEWAMAWPWPQIVETQNRRMVGLCPLSDDSIGFFTLEVVNSVLTATLAADMGSAYDLLSVDLSEYYGHLLIGAYYSDGTVASWVRARGSNVVNPVNTHNYPEFATATIFNGQCILGGLSPRSNSIWADLGMSSVLWSQVGVLDFDPLNGLDAGYIVEIPCLGNVVKVQALKSNVYVFSTNGVCKMIPTEIGYSIEELSQAGIKCARHVASDGRSMVYLDNNYMLWYVDENEKFNKLGYRYILKPQELVNYVEELLQWNVTVDRGNGRYYICNGIQCLVFNKFKMYEIHQMVSSAFTLGNGFTVGIVDNLADRSGYMITYPTNFGYNAFNTIGFIEIGGKISNVNRATPVETHVGLDYCYDIGNEFTSGPWIYAGPNGVGYQGISGSDFRIKFRVSDYRNTILALEYLRVKVKFTDKRYTRGTNASTVNR
jgi:hypothetical protein